MAWKRWAVAEVKSHCEVLMGQGPAQSARLHKAQDCLDFPT